MKIFNHPVHILLIHFPTAFFPMDIVCSLIGYGGGDQSFTKASFYAMTGGVILGWLSIIFGTFDLLDVFHSKPGAMKYTLLHGSINTAVVSIYSILFFLQFRRYPFLQIDTLPVLGWKVAANCLLVAGNFLGANLVLKHKIAVEHD